MAACGVRPDAMLNASGNATKPTVTPGIKSCTNSPMLYFHRQSTDFGNQRSTKLEEKDNGANKLALNYEHSRFVIIHKDCVYLLVVRAISDVIPSLDRVPQMNISKVPCDKTLTAIRKVLLIVVLSDILSNPLVHCNPPFASSVSHPQSCWD